MARKRWTVGFLYLLFAVAGCSKSGPAPVSGIVRLNGQPLPKVQVEFWPEKGSPRSIGTTDSNGRFTLVTDGTAQIGAVVGRHKVVLHDLTVYEAIGIRPKEDTNIREKPARFSHRYNDPHQTPVSVDVRPGPNDVEITVEPG